MNDFRTLNGFEEALRAPIDVRRARITGAVLPRLVLSRTETMQRFERIARGVPEVMVKITGRTRDGGHLRAHLDYISRNGAVDLEGPDGERLLGAAAVRSLASNWEAELAMEPSRRRDSPVSLSVVLSMPAGTEPFRLHDAGRAFAARVFGDRFPYVFALHDEGRHPHVHLTVRMLGADGEKLNPRKADLQLWREEFAHALRARSIEAEATPRRSRGVTLKAERTPVRKMRERFEHGSGPAPDVLRAAVRQAMRSDADPARTPWRSALARRRARIERALLAEAVKSARSGLAGEEGLVERVLTFLKERPPLETRDQMIRRRFMETDRETRKERDRTR